MPTLSTPASRIEARDAATCAWHECADDDATETRLRHVTDTLKHLGFTANPAHPGDYAMPTVFVMDRIGAGITLEFDPMQDGFSYPTEGDDAMTLNA